MMRPLFMPSLRSLAIIAALVATAFAVAFYLRYQVIENAGVGIACDTARTTLCTLRRTTIMLFTPSAFGWTALVAALITLWRPATTVFGLGLIAAALGLVLYNVQLSALAVGLLILSLARRAPEPE